MNKDGKRHRGYWKRLIAAALCASITVTTVFPDNGVAFAVSLEDAVATEETSAADEFGEIAADVKEEAAIVAEDTAGRADQVWHHNCIFLRCQWDASEENSRWNRLQLCV